VHPATWLEDLLTSKGPGFFTVQAFAPDHLPHDLSDLEMTWLPWRPGAPQPQSNNAVHLTDV